MSEVVVGDWVCPVCSGINFSPLPKCEKCGFNRADIEILAIVQAGGELTAFDAEEWYAAGREIRSPGWQGKYFKGGLEVGNPFIYSVALRGLRSINHEIPVGQGEPLIFKRRIRIHPAAPSPGGSQEFPAAQPATAEKPNHMFSSSQAPVHATSPASSPDWTCPVCFASNKPQERCSRCGLPQEDESTIVTPRDQTSVGSLTPDDAERWYSAGTLIRDLDWRFLFYEEGLEFGHPAYYACALRGINLLKRVRGPPRKRPTRQQVYTPPRQQSGTSVRFPTVPRWTTESAHGEAWRIYSILCIVVLLLIMWYFSGYFH